MMTFKSPQWPTWYERREWAIEAARNYTGTGRPIAPAGPLIGRVFMFPKRIHFPGWPRAIILDGLVPLSLGGVRNDVPSWGLIEGYFQRREKAQNRRL